LLVAALVPELGATQAKNCDPLNQPITNEIYLACTVTSLVSLAVFSLSERPQNSLWTPFSFTNLSTGIREKLKLFTQCGVIVWKNASPSYRYDRMDPIRQFSNNMPVQMYRHGISVMTMLGSLWFSTTAVCIFQTCYIMPRKWQRIGLSPMFQVSMITFLPKKDYW
jgi:hypothetical protein